MLKTKWVLLTLLLGAAMIFAGCNDETATTGNTAVLTNANTATVNTTTNTVNTTVNTTTAPATTGAVVEPGAIVANPNNYIGKTVTINGDVEEVFGARVFTLDEETIAGNTDLLVLTPQKPGMNLEEIDDNWLNDGIRVTGTVRAMVAADVEREIGWDLDRELEVEYNGRPVVIANSIARTADR